MPEVGKYAEVIVDLPSGHLDQSLTYRIPPSLKGEVKVGSMVLVPLQNRRSIGYVLEISPSSSVAEVKEVISVLPPNPILREHQISLCRWIAEYYLTPFSRSLRLALPPGRARKISEMIELVGSGTDNIQADGGLKEKHRQILTHLSQMGRLTRSDLKKCFPGKSTDRCLRRLEELGLIKRTFTVQEPRAELLLEEAVYLQDYRLEDRAQLKGSRKQEEILSFLETHGDGIAVRELLVLTGSSRSSLKRLVEKGFCHISQVRVRRDIMSLHGVDEEWEGGKVDLTIEQARAVEEISASLEKGDGQVFLLKGITGSGKTEVYLRCAQKALDQGRNVLILVPEISLTPQMIRFLSQRLGIELGVFHSHLSPSERYDQWVDILNGKIKIVVGTRSAIFSPLDNLGLIVVDEEHDPSYKESVMPRYHAREAAVRLAKIFSATLVLGSATPALESMYKARRGEYRLLGLSTRVPGRKLPQVSLIDLKQEKKERGGSDLLSSTLLTEMSDCLSRGEQAILFLNRRGFANFLICSRCGHVPKCRNCDISLTFHKKDRLLVCHHCYWKERAPDLCPACENISLILMGAGTQRVEETLQKIFPHNRVIRMDADTTRPKLAHFRLLEEFRQERGAILLGTQMITKGLHFPNVTLVGVVSADTALNLPDFRAAERTFQLLTQVSGRSGRGEKEGKVIVQSYNPTNYAVQLAVAQDYDSFYEEEVEKREDLGYPPFSHIINLIFLSKDRQLAEEGSTTLKKMLGGSRLAEKGLEILGPAPCPLPRVKNFYRWHIIIKMKREGQEKNFLREVLNSFYRRKKEELRLVVDVDPVWIL